MPVERLFPLLLRCEDVDVLLVRRNCDEDFPANTKRCEFVMRLFGHLRQSHGMAANCSEIHRRECRGASPKRCGLEMLRQARAEVLSLNSTSGCRAVERGKVQ